MTVQRANSGGTRSNLIDLRSDTVTRPCAGMRAAMAAAEVGDDVYGDDPTVRTLEERMAALAGKAAAAFFPSGTQSNLAALLAHCGRGDEVLVGRDYHIFADEAGGGSVLGGLMFDPLTVGPDGALDPAEITAAIKPDDSHYARTRLLCLENTFTGRAVPLAAQDAAAQAGRAGGLAVHLDGARGFNAALALGVDLARLAQAADSVSLCLSKGLGTPAGTVLCGSADLIRRARRWRKMLGGGMRQTGILAAAGLFALDHVLPEMAQDHRRAGVLRDALAGLPGLEVDGGTGQTNMVLARLTGTSGAMLKSALLAQGVVTSPGPDRVRLVVHRGISDADIAHVGVAFAAVLT